MPPKSTSNKWADTQLVIATIALTSVLALWNMFAGSDTEKAAKKVAEGQSTPSTVSSTPAPVIAPTLPPLGYTVLFGGEAPKPKTIVVQNNGGGGGGGNPVTQTKTS